MCMCIFYFINIQINIYKEDICISVFYVCPVQYAITYALLFLLSVFSYLAIMH